MTNVKTYPIFYKESDWKLCTQKEYSMLSAKEINDLPNENWSMGSRNCWTKEQIIDLLQHLAKQGNWTAKKVLSEI